MGDFIGAMFGLLGVLAIVVMLCEAQEMSNRSRRQ